MRAFTTLLLSCPLGSPLHCIQICHASFHNQLVLESSNFSVASARYQQFHFLYLCTLMYRFLVKLVARAWHHSTISLLHGFDEPRHAFLETCTRIKYLKLVDNAIDELMLSLTLCCHGRAGLNLPLSIRNATEL